MIYQILFSDILIVVNQICWFLCNFFHSYFSDNMAEYLWMHNESVHCFFFHGLSCSCEHSHALYVSCLWHLLLNLWSQLVTSHSWTWAFPFFSDLTLHFVPTQALSLFAARLNLCTLLNLYTYYQHHPVAEQNMRTLIHTCHQHHHSLVLDNLRYNTNCDM